MTKSKFIPIYYMLCSKSKSTTLGYVIAYSELMFYVSVRQLPLAIGTAFRGLGVSVPYLWSRVLLVKLRYRRLDFLIII